MSRRALSALFTNALANANSSTRLARTSTKSTQHTGTTNTTNVAVLMNLEKYGQTFMAKDSDQAHHSGMPRTPLEKGPSTTNPRYTTYGTQLA